MRDDGWQARGGNNRQRRRWDHRAPSWDHEGAAGLEAVIATVLAVAQVRPGTVAVDLGAGTGSLSLPLAQQGADVTAVDISPAMLERLAEKAARAGLDRVRCVAAQVENFDLPPMSVDLVVSNYALHHLRDAEKDTLVRAVARWLRPGGQLIVADMMFGRGMTARDRAIIGSKVTVLARRGRLVAAGQEHRALRAPHPRETGDYGDLGELLSRSGPDGLVRHASGLRGGGRCGDQTSGGRPRPPKLRTPKS